MIGKTLPTCLRPGALALGLLVSACVTPAAIATDIGPRFYAAPFALRDVPSASAH